MGVKRIDAERAAELMKTGHGYIFIDVRMEHEYVEGHVPSAENIPVMIKGPGGVGIQMNPEFVPRVSKSYATDTRIILGCQKGGRSNKAAELLSEAGYTNLHDMRGGFIGETDPLGKVTFPGWATRGLPVDQRKSSARA